MAKKFVEGVREWELTVRINKTKAMAVGERLDDNNTASLQVENGEIEMEEQFTKLGSVMSRDDYVMEDVKGRIAKAAKGFGCLRNPVFKTLFSLFKPRELCTRQRCWQCYGMGLRCGL